MREMKGGHGHGHGHGTYSSSSRRKWMKMYVVMVIVCGCVILGLMGLDTLKQTRFLNHTIKLKDDQILTLNLLFQKEKEQMQQVKRITEEMKTKIFNLGAQKTELNARVLHLQSTISSLRDEQNTIETAYLRKQNEANLLRHQYLQIKDHNTQLKALAQVLGLRDAEILDLKHHLQFRGATDQKLIISPNVSAKANMSDQTTGNENNMNDALSHRETESSLQSDEHGEINATSERNSKQGFKRLENSKEARGENGGSETGVEKKMEMQENEHRFRWKQGYLKRSKGKRWRQISKQTQGNTSVEDTGESGDKGKPKNQDGIQNSIIGLRMQNESVSRNQQFEIDGQQQSKEHKITMTERADNNEDGQHDNRLGRKEV